MTLAKQFAAYSEWRQRLSGSLADFHRRIVDHGLGDIQTDQRFERLFEKLRDDRLNVAFVAEFSRGKSELINAIFFAHQGNRMLPSRAGRTTMCPTELMYDPSKPPNIALLPIETRETGTSVSVCKENPGAWTVLPLATASPNALQETLHSVSEVRRVPRKVAEKLGFDEEDATPVGAIEDDEVEIPRWRHAVINYPHPLLQQGLVILDTPGLNAIGAEPELTLSLLPSAHAILFILAADTGVTQSDLAVWKQHIGSGGNSNRGRIVVLNKIDGLWDGLKSETEITAEIERQVRDSAETLGLSRDRIFPVSAQKGLVARVNGDGRLLERSRLSILEHALSSELIPARQEITRENVESEFSDIHANAHSVFETRLTGLREQISELAALRGKNKGIVEYMMRKVRSEKEEFEAGLQRYYAVRSIFSQLTNRLFRHLGLDSLNKLARTTRRAMEEATFSRSLSDAMRGFFDASRRNLKESDKIIAEILQMIDASQRKLVVEHGLKLSNPSAFALTRQQQDVNRLDAWCDTHLNTVFQFMTHEKKQLTERFFSEVTHQIRRVFQSANREVDAWSKSLIAPMEAQIRERQIQLKRRLESIQRIHQATDTLEERIKELMHLECELLNQQHALDAAAQRVYYSLRTQVSEAQPRKTA